MVPNSKTSWIWNSHVEGKRQNKAFLSNPSDRLTFKRTVKNYSGVGKSYVKFKVKLAVKILLW